MMHYKGSPKDSSSPKNCQELPLDALAAYSPKDWVWDLHRAQAQAVQAIYAAVETLEQYALRINHCSGILYFAPLASDDGSVRLRLREALFCRVRHCPVCQWRRTLMWLARFYEALPKIQESYPNARWLFLTLTVRNCPVHDLRKTLQAMNQAWHRLTKRKEFKVLGWIRTTEVTRGKDGSAHPHFHVLLMVSPSWFSGKNYVTQSRWTELWKECARLDYTPIVDIRAVRNKFRGGEDDPLAGLCKAAAETLKYAVKPSDMTEDPEWFIGVTHQVHQLRFVATGGALKDALRVDEESNEDLILADQPGEQRDNGIRLAFSWKPVELRYRRFPLADRIERGFEE